MQLKPPKMISINIKGVLQIYREKKRKYGGKKYYQKIPEVSPMEKESGKRNIQQSPSNMPK